MFHTSSTLNIEFEYLCSAVMHTIRITEHHTFSKHKINTNCYSYHCRPGAHHKRRAKVAVSLPTTFQMIIFFKNMLASHVYLYIIQWGWWWKKINIFSPSAKQKNVTYLRSCYSVRDNLKSVNGIVCVPDKG